LRVFARRTSKGADLDYFLVKDDRAIF